MGVKAHIQNQDASASADLLAEIRAPEKQLDHQPTTKTMRDIMNTQLNTEVTAGQKQAADAARFAIYTPAMLSKIADQHAGGYTPSEIESDLGIEIRPELAALLNAR